MRKNSIEFIVLLSLIKLAILCGSILTPVAPEEMSSVLKEDTAALNVTKNRRLARIRYGASTSNQSFSTVALHASQNLKDRPSKNIQEAFHHSAITAVLIQNPSIGMDAKAFLINYLDQLQPTDEQHLRNVIEIATEARDQLLAEQTPELENIDAIKIRIYELLDRLAENSLASRAHAVHGLYEKTSTYLENLTLQRDLRRSASLAVETIDGLQIEKRSVQGDDSTVNAIAMSLAETRANLEELNAKLAKINDANKGYENLISDASVKELFGGNYEYFFKLLVEYKTKIDRSLDSEIIISKFDNILAAIEYVDFRGI